MVAWIAMNEAIDPHQNPSTASQALEAVEPLSVVVCLLNPHDATVAHRLRLGKCCL